MLYKPYNYELTSLTSLQQTAGPMHAYGCICSIYTILVGNILEQQISNHRITYQQFGILFNFKNFHLPASPQVKLFLKTKLNWFICLFCDAD